MFARLKIFLLILIFIAFFNLNAQEKKILVLHSYHQGLEWTDSVNEGIRSVLNSENDSIEVIYDYLDFKRNTSVEFRDYVKKYLLYKEIGKSYDVIISCDNDALNLLSEIRNDIFINIPIVFCGINNFNDSLIAGLKNITGIVEKPDFESTINLIKKFHPQVNNLYIINDDKTTTSVANLQILHNLQSAFEGILKFHYWTNYSIDELKNKIQKLTKEDAILMSTYSQDKDGNYISYKGSKVFIPENSNVPKYAVWEFFGNDVVIGGKMLRGQDQGAEATKIALRIIEGEDVNSIPIVSESLSRYTFYYNQLKRFGIKEESLPKGSVIVNKPILFYAQKKVQIIMVISVIVSLLVILILGISNERKNKIGLNLLRKQEYLQKSFKFQKMHAKVVTLLNSSSDFKQVIDKVLKIIISYYPIDQISLYRLNKSESEVGSQISSSGLGFVKLEPKDYLYMRRIIEIIEGLGFYSTNDLSNLNNEEKQFCVERNIASFCLFAVKIEDRLLGIAGFSQTKTFDWNKQLIEELSTFVKLIASSWERSEQVVKLIEAEKENLKATQVLEQSARLSTIGIIASGLTHEINQPLNALRVTVDAIKYWEKRNVGVIPDVIEKKLDTLSKGIERIDNIIKHMRTYWIAPDDENVRSVVDFNVAAKNAYSLVENQVIENNIDLTLSLPEEFVFVEANQTQIEQIIINLVVNSIQAFKKSCVENRKIDIEVNESGNYVILVVSDNATGIDPGIGEKLFDPFFSTKIIEEGTGLGLALVKSFIEKIGGRVDYLNNEMGGVSFFVSICKKLKS